MNVGVFLELTHIQLYTFLWHGRVPDRDLMLEKMIETFKKTKRIAQESLHNVCLQCALGPNHSEDRALSASQAILVIIHELSL